MRKHHYMTHDERQKLEILYNKTKMPVAQIAKALGFSRSTIYNELKRGEVQLVRHPHGYLLDVIEYSACKAEMLHKEAQSKKGRPLKIGKDIKYAIYLEEMILKYKYSPAAALAAAKKAGFATTICKSTLYSYIDKYVFLELTNKDLWMKSKKKKKAGRPSHRIAHPNLPSIVDRPQHINNRSEYGHWEMDLIVGKQGTAPVLLTLTERMTRKEMIFKLPDKKAATVKEQFDKLERRMPDFKYHFKSITTDNGAEFIKYDELQRSVRGGKRFEIWYCHSYAAWEKGSNENHNRMIRRWIPKGTDIGKVTKKRIAAIQDWMNNYPRQILNWMTPNDVLQSNASCTARI